MADREVDYRLVGGGMASAHCAAELRRRGAKGSIVLVGREPEPPYERPPLSKEYLRNQAARQDAYVHEPAWYEQHGVELLSARNVMSLDSQARTALLQGGEEVAFAKALLATGALVNILRVEGAENEGIHYLRAFGNADAIRSEAGAAKHVVLIGGSYIATEVAASLTAIGAKCTMLMMEDVTLSRTFGEEVGRWFQNLIESHGVTVYGGEELEAFEGDGRVQAVVMKSGLSIPCDAVVVGAGVRPDVALAQRAGLEVEDGSSAIRSCSARLPRSTRPGTAVRMRALCTGGACGLSTGTWRCSRACTLPTTCLVRTSTMRWFRISSATSQIGRASSTSARPKIGTKALAR